VPLSTWQFLQTRRALEDDSFEPNIALPLVFSGAVFLLGLAVVWFVFANSPAPLR